MPWQDVSWFLSDVHRFLTRLFCMGLLWLRRPHEFGSPSGGHQKYFQQEASESSAMVALLLLRCWLCMLLSGVYGSHFSTRAELRDALLQRLGCDPVQSMTNSFASMTSQSIRLMRRQQMFGGRKRPNVRVARCLYRRSFLHDVAWCAFGRSRKRG